MSSATLAHDEAHEGHHTSLPIDNRKLAIWTFIGSECLFFATLISTFLIYKDNHPKGPGPKEIFEVRGAAGHDRCGQIRFHARPAAADGRIL